MHEADRRAAAGKPAVRVLILTKARVGRGYAYIGGEMKFMAHVPGIAMNNHDQWLRAGRRRLA
jgi:hypothetical protein